MSVFKTIVLALAIAALAWSFTGCKTTVNPDHLKFTPMKY